MSTVRDDRHVRQGGMVTIAGLYAAHRVRLVRLAVLLVDDQETAEDVVQDVFARLHRHWVRLRDHDRALAYLQRAVVNSCRSALRRRRSARQYVAPHEPASSGPETSVLLAEEHREVLVALDRLPGRQREVLVLRYWSDLTESEIAEVMRVSPGTVKSTASRALDAMEEMLEGRR